MAKVVLSDWININVPDHAVWGQYVVISQSEEYRQGASKVRRETTMSARDATITGKEIKAYLAKSASSLRPAAGALLGIVWAVVSFILLKKSPDFADLGFMAVVIGPVLGLALIGLGIYGFLKARGASPEIQAISSWKSLEPYIEAALKEKVVAEEEAKRRREMGNKGEAFSGISCFTPREVLQAETKANPTVHDIDIRSKMKTVAESVPESGLKLTRR